MKKSLISLFSGLSLSLGCLSPALAAQSHFDAFPKETISTHTLHFDLWKWVGLLSDLQKHLPEAEFKKEDLSEIMEEFELENEAAFKDLIFNLGEDHTLAFTAKGPFMAIDIRSEEKAHDFLKHLVENEPDFLESEETSSFGGETLYHFWIDDIAVHAAVIEKQILLDFAEEPDTLKNMLYTQRVLSEHSSFRLSSQEDFQAMQKLMKSQDLWSYFNTQNAKGFFENINWNDFFEMIGEDLSDLEDAEELEELKKIFSLSPDLVSELLAYYRGVGIGFEIKNWEDWRFRFANTHALSELSPGQKEWMKRQAARNATQLKGYAPNTYLFLGNRNPSAGDPFPLSPAYVKEIEDWSKILVEADDESAELQAMMDEYIEPYFNGAYAFSVHENPKTKKVESLLRVDLKSGQGEAFQKMVVEALENEFFTALLGTASKAESIDGTEVYALKLNEESQEGYSALLNWPGVFLETADYAQVSSLKANMYTFQTMIETYGVDWGGTYAKDAESLIKEAKTNSNPYWKETMDPFNEGEPQRYIDFKDYRQGDVSQAGVIVYQAISKGDAVTAYKIWGIDQKGQIVTDRDSSAALVLCPDSDCALPEGVKISPQVKEEPSVNAEIDPVFAVYKDQFFLAQSPEVLKHAMKGPQSALPIAKDAENTLVFDFEKWSKAFGRSFGYLNQITMVSQANQETEYVDFAFKGPILKILNQVGNVFGEFGDLVDGLDVSAEKQPVAVSSFSAKESSLAANMHTFQTIVETYGVDWGGVYAPSAASLQKEAKTNSNPYWKSFKNPFTGQSGLNKSFADYSSFKKGDASKAGQVLYGISPDDDTTYWIYGVNETGDLISRSGEALILTNS